MTAKQVRFVTNDEPFDNQNVAELAAFDAAGVEALRVLVAAARTGLWGVRALQEALGVAVDGAYGPKTHAAAVAWAAR